MRNKLLRYLPVTGLLAVSTPKKSSGLITDLIKLYGHLIYSVVGLSYLIVAPIAGQFNPVKLYQEGRIRYQKQGKRNDLWNRVFGANGHADKNRDGSISFDELHDALQRMNYGERSVNMAEILFPELSDLERAVESYEKEGK